jgi:dTDP-glucose pyrophosphorylase
MLGGLKPSTRGELELVDIDNYYLKNELEMTHYGGFFGDMGTPEGLERVSRHIRENKLPM